MSTKLFTAKGALARVDLSNNNNDKSASPDFIRPIANALKVNTSITEINLSKNNLNAEAAGVLFSDAVKDSNRRWCRAPRVRQGRLYS